MLQDLLCGTANPHRSLGGALGNLCPLFTWARLYKNRLS